jgi:hypothetical protein
MAEAKVQPRSHNKTMNASAATVQGWKALRNRWSANRNEIIADQAIFHVAVFLISALILYSRRPDAFLNAQFYAEDGTFWYAGAYQLGWRCLLLPEAGYLSTLPRLIALFTQFFPFSLAPLIMNVAAIAVQICPVNLFLSSRFRAISFGTRGLAALLYLALPNSSEIHANSTNIQWHLALLACLVLLAKPGSRSWLFFDVPVLVLATLDGPLGFFLIPVAAAVAWTRRDLRSRALLAVLMPGAIIQAVTVALSRSRVMGDTGASLAGFKIIFGGQVVLGSLIGTRGLVGLTHLPGVSTYTLLAAIIGMLFLAYATVRGPFELKLFVVFCLAVFMACLFKPLADKPGFQWQIMAIPGNFGRYFFLPMLAFLTSLIWSVAEGRVRIAKYAAVVILLLMSFGIYKDWRYPEFLDLNFRETALEFEHAAPGTRVTFLLNPDWQMQLTKKP